ncbi:MAG TPA: hypothetical protein VGW75_04710 [Solirubrobacteraceae bacterium]|jgi:hypothetical protein|nr:hypothetical protein [Solirubrobacteraceae bacterium]
MDTPIACSLNASEFAARREETAAIARAALRGREPIDGGERLRFAGGEDLAGQIREIVDAEAECCPFLTLDLRRDGEALELDVTGPPEAQPIIAELFA